MKLSTKGRYGLKAMIDIAVYGEDKKISIKCISERQNISENYLEQLIALLRQAGLVKSTRGAQGGYSLTKPPNLISIGEILRALEGSLAPVACVGPEEYKDCGDDCSCCVSKTVWSRLYDSINEVVDSITLMDLAEDYKKANAMDCGEQRPL